MTLETNAVDQESEEIAESPLEQSRYWQRPHRRKAGGAARLFPGEELAALRRGAGREAGSVPELWPYYTTLNRRGDLSAELVAEHHALVLFGFHQQSRAISMHVQGKSLGAALRELRSSPTNPGDVDGPLTRRLAALAGIDDVDALAVHLRGIVSLLRDRSVGLDYERLFWELSSWRKLPIRAKTLRRWASDYYTL